VTAGRLILASLRHYWRTHLGVAGGAAVAVAVLTGALLVGDSVGHTLHRTAALRLGRTRLAIRPRQRFFRAALAAELGRRLGAPAAAALALDGWCEPVAAGGGQANAADRRWGGKGRPAPLECDDAVAASAFGPARAPPPSARHDRLYRGSPEAAGKSQGWRLASGSPLRPGLQTTGPTGLAGSPHDARVTSPTQGHATAVNVLGVDGAFWRMGDAPDPLAAGQTASATPKVAVARTGKMPVPRAPARPVCAVSARLAERLGVAAGGTLRVRIAPPARLPREAPLSVARNDWIGDELPVAAVVADEDFGRFSLQADQLAPLNLFVPRDWLARRTDVPGRANLLLLGGQAPPDQAQAALADVWTLADAQLSLREWRDAGVVELRSERVFLSPPVIEAARGAGEGATGVLTYFADEITAGAGPQQRSSPYAFVAAMENLPAAVMRDAADAAAPLADGEIVINEWLAEDLHVGAGDAVTLHYHVLGPMRRLKRQSRRFTVARVIPWSSLAADRNMLPDFPGLADVENCRDWDPGVAFDPDKVRPKDQTYWKKHGGTPKAFVTLAAGQAMWANPYGRLTAVRWPLRPGAKQRIAKALRKRLGPAAAGLVLEPVGRQARAAAGQAVDFGQLFIGFSLFLIVAAVLLMALLFALAAARRAEQTGLLLATGWRPGRVRRLLLAEGGVLAVAGSIVGLAGGVLYTAAMLASLRSLWPAAVAHAAVRLHVTARSLALGGGAGLAVALAAIWLVLRRQAKAPARALLQGDVAPPTPARPSGLEGGALGASRAHRSWRLPWGAAGLCALGAAAAVAWAFHGGDPRSAVVPFFLSGALLLAGGLAAALAILSGGGPADRLGLRALAARNARRRRGRSLAVVALLACGVFLVVAVGANRRDPAADARQASAGTGGYELWIETALPIYRDLNEPDGRRHYRLDADLLAGVRFLPLRSLAGDEASCRNLNRAQRPALLGAGATVLAERGAFTFTGTTMPAEQPWRLLTQDLGDDVVPAVADAETITWALGKKLGDEIEYVDEAGRTFRVRLVGQLETSVFQGYVLIGREAFRQRFPSQAGARLFLADVPAGRIGTVAAHLADRLRERAATVQRTENRLAAFNAVINTYLSIFQAIGGLGVLLGSAGLAMVVLRNVLERRGELALLRAVGFRRRRLTALVAMEHLGLLAGGVVVGTVAAAVAVAPALTAPGADVPYVPLAATVGAITAAGVLWTLLASVWALRGPLLPALRAE